MSTKYIEVLDFEPARESYYPYDDYYNNNNDVEYLDEDMMPSLNHRARKDQLQNKRNKSPINDTNGELQGSIEGPINPTNYAGTQINIWGFPPADLGSFIDPSSSRAQLGFMTEQMINVNDLI